MKAGILSVPCSTKTAFLGGCQGVQKKHCLTIRRKFNAALRDSIYRAP